MLNRDNFLNILQQSNLLNSVPCAIFLKDIQSRFIGCNDFLAHLAGFSSAESIIGKNDYEMPWADRSLDYAAIDREVISNKKTVERIETIRLANKTITARTTKAPFYLNGEVIGLIGTFTDITDIVELKNSAEAANRAKTEFLSNISHDVLTPLVSISILGQLIMESPENIDAETGEIIKNCANRLSMFFENCLNSSRIELDAWSMENKTFSLESIALDIYELLLPTARTKNLVFSTLVDKNLPPKLYGPYSNFYRIILNLTSNAIKFTSQGSVTVNFFLITENKDEARIGLSVSDTGPGIPEDKLDVIFEKSHRLTPSYENKVKGSGMGLYIVDQYIKRMGGSIEVKSRLGEGSIFTITVPFKKETTELSR